MSGVAIRVTPGEEGAGDGDGEIEAGRCMLLVDTTDLYTAFICMNCHWHHLKSPTWLCSYVPHAQHCPDSSSNHRSSKCSSHESRAIKSSLFSKRNETQKNP